MGDLHKPTGVFNWYDFTTQTLDAARAAGRPVHFDLTYASDVPGMLDGRGRHGHTVTAHELRHIRDHWSGGFDRVVMFYRDGAVVPPPWPTR